MSLLINATYANPGNAFYALQGQGGGGGSTGPAGPTGSTGSIGATGAQGIPGVDANTGATGPAGVAGVTGSIGATGATGAQGIQGIPGQSATGSTGITGPTGASTNGAEWYLYAAESTVDLSNNSIINGNLITAQGATFANPIPFFGGTQVIVGGTNGGLPNILTVNGIANVTSILSSGAIVNGSLTNGSATFSGDVTCSAGDSGALYVTGGFTQTPGANNFIHGAHLGAANVTVEVEGVPLSLDLCRIDVLPVGIDVVSPTFVTIDAGGAANIAAGGAISIAAGGTVTVETGNDMYIQGPAGVGFTNLRWTNGGGAYNMGNISGNNDTGVYIENVNNLIGRLNVQGTGMNIGNVTNLSGPPTYGTINNISSIELGYATPLYGPTGSLTGYTGFTGSYEYSGTTGVTGPSGTIEYTGYTGTAYYEGQTGYSYTGQAVIGVSGEASSILNSPDGTGLYWNGNLIAGPTGPVPVPVNISAAGPTGGSYVYTAGGTLYSSSYISQSPPNLTVGTTGTILLSAGSLANPSSIEVNDGANNIVIQTQDPSGAAIVLLATGAMSLQANTGLQLSSQATVSIGGTTGVLIPGLPASTTGNVVSYDTVAGTLGYTATALQTLGVSGDYITISGVTGATGANVSTTTTVASNTQKLTAVSYDLGLLNTTVDGDFTVNNDSVLKGSVSVGVPFSFPPKNLTVFASVIPGSITDASGSGGLADQVLSAGAGDQVKWITPPYGPTGPTGPAATVSEWATFKAVANIDASSNKLINLAPGSTGTDGTNYSQLTFRDSTEFYVSTQGSDISGNGSILAPFLTIQKAVTTAELISSASLICVINVASGHYTENLTFNKGYVVLNGSLQGQNADEVCEINGSISIACVGANDVFNRQVAFQGFNITMTAVQNCTNTSSSSHTVSFQDCSIFVNSAFYVSSATAPDMRTYFTNVDIASTASANVATVITTNVGLVEMERVDLTVDGNAIGIAIAGTSNLTRCSLSTFENTNTAAILKPHINITSSTTSAHSIALTSFIFTSAVAKTNSSAVAIASSINTTINMLNCFFTLAGTSNSTNNCISYNGVGSPVLLGVNNTSLSINVSLPQTVSVQSGITQIQYTNIDPPGLASYSSTADQVIAVSGTPQALTYNTTLLNQGTTLVANSRIYVSAQGNYQLNYKVELQHSGAGATQIATTFLKKNGTTIANTGSQWSIPSASFQNAASATYIISLNIGDYVEVFFNGDTSLSANATASAGALPAIPSVVFNLTQIR